MGKRFRAEAGPPTPEGLKHIDVWTGRGATARLAGSLCMGRWDADEFVRLVNEERDEKTGAGSAKVAPAGQAAV